MRCLLVPLLLAACSPSRETGGDTALDPSAWILQAGQTSDDGVRYETLLALSEVLDESAHPELADDLALLLPVMDQWANGLDHWEPGEQDLAGEDGYLAGFFSLKVWPDGVGETYPPSIDEDHELYPIWCMLRGRMQIWTAIENGLFTDELYADGRVCLAVSAAAYPDNAMVGMYLGSPVPWEDERTAHPDAPDWANRQRIALSRLDEIMGFWATQRQAPDGQLGGGWGDDVELWRKWTPVLIGFSGTDSHAAQERLAQGVWARESMAGGYTDRMIDVEHGAEDSGDSLTPMLLIDPGAAEWAERADALAGLAERTWMGTNARGQQQFQSAYLSSVASDDDPDHACDTPYHTRVLQPALLRWQQTRDPALGAVLQDWLATWVAAAALEEGGKPAGVLPAALWWPSGAPRGPGSEDWFDPGCHYTGATFAYPRAQSGMYRSLVLAAYMTDDPSYLAPLEQLADLWRSGEGSAEEGGAAWALSESRGHLLDGLAKHWLLTGEETHTDLLLDSGSPYVRYRLTGDVRLLQDALDATEAALSVDLAAHTTELRFTDRLFKFHTKYRNTFADDAVPSPNVALLYNMVTGDVGDPLYLPLPAVRWETSPREIAILVTASSPTALSAELFLFDGDRDIGLSLLRWQGSGGSWTLQCGDSTETSGTFEGQSVQLSFPSQQHCTLDIR